jgi:epoxyqueuosine reductase
MKEENKPPVQRLLLHTCCAPCSVYITPELSKDYEVTCFFYNPNIDNPEEYVKRKDEMESLAELKGFSIVPGEYEREIWRERIRGFENSPEGGERCEQCFYLRLEKTAETAEKLGFDLFATTLTISPVKDHQVINQQGERASQGKTAEYMPSDFKKENGYQQSVTLSKQLGLYRQNYCGCSFSQKDK